MASESHPGFVAPTAPNSDKCDHVTLATQPAGPPLPPPTASSSSASASTPTAPSATPSNAPRRAEQKQKEKETGITDDMKAADMPSARACGLKQQQWLDIYWSKLGREKGLPLTNNEKAWNIPKKSDEMQWSSEQWGEWCK